jgi:signal transduction histidine kinase
MPFLFRLACLVALLGVAGARAQDATLEITPAERAWLANHPVIRLGFDPDFKPFCFRDPQGKLQGIDADLLHWMESRLGVRFETHTAANWHDVYQGALRGECDVLSSTADTPERRENFLFTRDYVRFPVTIITRTEGAFALTSSDLRNLRVAAPRDYAATLAFRRTYPDVSVVACDSIAEGLAMVAHREADAAVTNLANASYVIKTSGLTNLKIAGVVPETFELRFAVRRDQPELAAILDKTLAHLPPAEMSAILDRWIRIDYAAVIRWDVVRRWAIMGGVFALTVIGLVAWRNRSLARELAKRRLVQLELEKTNQQLNRANAELVARHDEKCELMRVAAHDLRSPLTAIRLSADLIEPAEPPAGTIRNAAQQMMRLIDDLLEVHELEEGRRVFRHEPLEISALLREVASGLAPGAQAKRIRLNLDGLAPTSPVLGDENALREVFDNLLSNAIKFSPFDREVAVCTRHWNGFVRIEVHDQGPGVPASERERIFSKYARGTAQPTAGERSTGLGLAIVRDIVALMNGRTWCENSPHGGAVFIVALPAAQLENSAKAEKKLAVS